MRQDNYCYGVVFVVSLGGILVGFVLVSLGGMRVGFVDVDPSVLDGIVVSVGTGIVPSTSILTLSSIGTSLVLFILPDAMAQITAPITSAINIPITMLPNPPSAGTSLMISLSAMVSIIKEIMEGTAWYMSNQ